MRKTLISTILLILLYSAHAQGELERYRCIEVKSDLAGYKIQYSIKRENSAGFGLNNCALEDLLIQVKNRRVTYERSIRLVEDGRIEKNDLFAIECSRPKPVDGNPMDNDRLDFSFYRGKISPLITPAYPVYPTLKQTAEKLNIETPHRTFVVLNGFGGATYEFFCYIDEKLLKKPSQDRCLYNFDESLDIHAKNKNTVAISNLAEKYFKRQDYEKAEKAYKRLMELTDNADYQGLLSVYFNTKQYQKAEEMLSKRLKESPFDTSLYISLARVYLFKNDYKKAEAVIKEALKLRFEEEEYKAHAMLGEVYIAERNYRYAVDSFSKALKLFEKACEDNKLMPNFFKKQDTPAIDCELQSLPYQLKIIYSLAELEDFKKAEKLATEIQTKASNDPYIYAHLAYIYSGKGEFDRALKMADKAISLFKRKGIGANIVKGEIYPIVISVDRNTPAERAGLKRGDKIINIGDMDLRLFREGKDIMEMLVEYIKSNESIRLKIHPENSTELKDVELKAQEFLKPEASRSLAFKALILKAKGNHSEFENQVLKAYELNPEDKLASIAMALLKTDKGRYNEAVEILEKGGKDRNDSLFLLIRPIIYAKAGKIDKAKDFFREIPEELLKTKNALYTEFLNEVKRFLK